MIGRTFYELMDVTLIAEIALIVNLVYVTWHLTVKLLLFIIKVMLAKE